MPVLVPEFVSAALDRGEKSKTVVGTCLSLEMTGMFGMIQEYVAGLADALAEMRRNGGFPAQLDAGVCVAVFPDDSGAIDTATRAARNMARRPVRMTRSDGQSIEVPLVNRAGLSHGTVTWERVGSASHSAPVLYGGALRSATDHCLTAETGTLQLDDTAVSLVPETGGPFSTAVTDTHLHRSPAEDSTDAALCLIRLDELAHVRERGREILVLSNEMDGRFNGFDFSRESGVARVLFGIPKVIEHPERRAVDFAVALRDRVPGELRAAIAAGPVHAGLHETEGSNVLLIVGATVERAQALLARDSMGEITIAPEIRSSIEEVYAVQPRGRARLPGYPKPVEVTEVLWREQGLRPAAGVFFGRDEELALLRAYLQADAEEPATAALVTGPPGIGKSTLVRAAVGEIPAASVLLVRGIDRELPGFWCLTEAVHEYWNLPLKDDPRFPDVVGERFDEMELRTADDDVRETLQRLRPFVEYSLGLRRPIVVSLDPETRHNSIRDGWVTLLRALHAVRVLWVDDLQWLDESSREVLESWISAYAHQRTRVVLCMRTTGTSVAADTVLGRPPIEIDVPALSSEASTALLAGRGIDRLIGHDEVQRLIERSVGNPFFLEQSARYLEEQLAEGPPPGTDHEDHVPAVPERVEALILARVARLSAEVREAAKRAAILGFRFDMRVLSAMLRQDSLMEAMEPYERESLWSATAELSEIFSHALVRDAVYESQLGSEQQALHAAAAAAYEEVYSGPERRSRLYEIADHYERAGIRDRALDCLAEAAEYALEEYENERALSLLRRRLALTEPDDLGAVRDLGRALIRVGAWQEAADLLENVASRFESMSPDADPREAVDCLVALADLYIDRGETETAVRLIQRGIPLAEEHDYDAGVAYLYRDRGLIAYRHQDLAAALRAYETGLSYARRDGGERVIARLYNDMAIVLTKMGRHEEALEAFRANLELARRLNEFAGISAALNNIGFLYSEMNRPDDAITYYREDLELCHAAGDRQGWSVAMGNIAIILAKLAQREEAIERFHEAIATDRQIGFLPHESYMHQELGRVLLDLDRTDKGCRELREALRIAEEIDFPMVRDAAGKLRSACDD